MRKQSDGVHSSSQLITVIDTSATGWEKEILSLHCIKWGGFICSLTEDSLFEGIPKRLHYGSGFLKGRVTFISDMTLNLKVILCSRW